MIPGGHAHVAALSRALSTLEGEIDRVEAWGSRLATVLVGGGRLLAAGNGGSAAQAQHLATELVGRYASDERPPLSALALTTDGSALTALGNDFGEDEIFARQVRAHGRPADVFLALSTSGSSPNVVAAAQAALDGGLTVWALTGPGPNRLAAIAHEAVYADAEDTPTIQELHLVVVHLLCAAVDATLAAPRPAIALAGGRRS